jgi:hypothetical protein
MNILKKSISLTIFFGFIYPISFLLKIFNNDILNQKVKKSKKSYWKKRR